MHLSTQGLARRVGCSGRLISYLEAGHHAPTQDFCQRLAYVHGALKAMPSLRALAFPCTPAGIDATIHP